MLYYLLNTKDGSYWDGSYHYIGSQRYGDAKTPTAKRNKTLARGFRITPRFFKTPSALWSSLHLIDARFEKQYRKAHPYPKLKDGCWGPEHWSWRAAHLDAYRAWVKTNKLSSVDLLRRLKAKGLVCYVVEDTIHGGKPL